MSTVRIPIGSIAVIDWRQYGLSCRVTHLIDKNGKVSKGYLYIVLPFGLTFPSRKSFNLANRLYELYKRRGGLNAA